MTSAFARKRLRALRSTRIRQARFSAYKTAALPLSYAGQRCASSCRGSPARGGRECDRERGGIRCLEELAIPNEDRHDDHDGGRCRDRTEPFQERAAPAGHNQSDQGRRCDRQQCNREPTPPRHDSPRIRVSRASGSLLIPSAAPSACISRCCCPSYYQSARCSRRSADVTCPSW